MNRLKTDLFGHVEREDYAGRSSVLRDTRSARWWARPLARHLLRRERRALIVLEGIERIPKLLYCDANHLRREWIEGLPMQRAAPPSGLPVWGFDQMRDTALGTLFDWWWPAMFGAPAPADAIADVRSALEAMSRRRCPSSTGSCGRPGTPASRYRSTSGSPARHAASTCRR